MDCKWKVMGNLKAGAAVRVFLSRYVFILSLSIHECIFVMISIVEWKYVWIKLYIFNGNNNQWSEMAVKFHALNC